jgi:hypothetical protein
MSGSLPSNPDELVAIGVTKISEISAIWRGSDERGNVAEKDGRPTARRYAIYCNRRFSPPSSLRVRPHIIARRYHYQADLNHIFMPPLEAGSRYCQISWHPRCCFRFEKRRRFGRLEGVGSTFGDDVPFAPFSFLRADLSGRNAIVGECLKA